MERNERSIIQRVYLAKVVYTCICRYVYIYIYLYVYADEVREWKVNERIIARMANFLDTDKEMFPLTKERIERITQ